MTRPIFRRYTPAQRAEAIGLGLSIGAIKASAQTGIPRRTISAWLARERSAPELEVLEVASREQIAARLWQAVEVGVEQVLAGLRDPRARLGDKARALEVVAQQHALLTGGLTSRSELIDGAPGLTADDALRLAEWLEARLLEGHDPAVIVEAMQLREGSENVG